MAIPHILIAEDDEEDMMIIQSSFDDLSLDCRLQFVPNGIEVMKQLSGCAAESIPCLIILDLNMPKMNGTETLRALKSQEAYRHIAVVIFSTSINEIERQECIRLGAADYVIKPTTYKEGVNTAAYFYELAQNSFVS